MLKEKLKSVLLVDDDQDCIFYHTRMLRKMDCTDIIDEVADGEKALSYLETSQLMPSIIFLDINMPRMDGWEFLVEYEKMESIDKSKTVIVMLTSSINPDDRTKAEAYGSVAYFNTKYLERPDVETILKGHFPELIAED